MSGFDPTWLALREAYDHAVRDRDLTAAFVEALGPRPRLIDLGCGTGSNLRFLAPDLSPGQRWTCIDHDPALLDVLQGNKPMGVDVGTACLDLAEDLEDVTLEPGVGVTAAALLDLASAAWLDRLALLSRRNPALFTLSYDGRMTWDPADPLDETVRDAFNRHQRGDKGFGPSLGPDAVMHLADRFRELGHAVRLASSDWVFAGDDRPILLAMVDGIAAAAIELDPELPIEAWKARRQGDIEHRRLCLTVGHQDLLALPA